MSVLKGRKAGITNATTQGNADIHETSDAETDIAALRDQIKFVKRSSVSLWFVVITLL